MWVFGETCNPGMTPNRFVTSTNMNSVVRYGAKRSPSGPMISLAIPSRTKLYADSASHCLRSGTSLGSR